MGVRVGIPYKVNGGGRSRIMNIHLRAGNTVAIYNFGHLAKHRLARFKTAQHAFKLLAR